MPKYKFIAESTLELDGYEDKRTLEVTTEGGLDEMTTVFLNFLQLDGFTYVDSVDIRKSDGSVVRGDLF